MIGYICNQRKRMGVSESENLPELTRPARDQHPARSGKRDGGGGGWKSRCVGPSDYFFISRHNPNPSPMRALSILPTLHRTGNTTPSGQSRLRARLEPAS